MSVSRLLNFVVVLVALGAAQVNAQTTRAQAYAASSDLREFVDRRSSSPQDGSYFYSYWARWECFDDGGIARRIMREAPPQAGSPQAEAIRVELKRCRNLPAEVSSGTLQRDDVQVGRAAGDKLFASFTGEGGAWFSVRDQADLLRALRLLSPDTDPNIVWVLAQKLAGLGASKQIALEGKRVSGEDGRSLYVAFLLAVCDLNVDCGRRHRWMHAWCMQNAECEDATIEAYWKRRESGTDDKMDWVAIGRYRSLIGRSANSGDWSSFSLLPSSQR